MGWRVGNGVGWIVGLMLAAVLSWTAVGQDRSEMNPEVAAALRDLQADTFIQRQLAVEVLKQFPEQAMPELLQLSQSFDPELALQARRLYFQLQEEVMDQKLQRFLAESAGRVASEESVPSESDLWASELPQWSSFAKQLGDSLETRQLYAAAVRLHINEFLAMQRDRHTVSENWERILGVHSEQTTLARPSIAAALVLASDADLWGEKGMEDRQRSELENRLAGNALAFRSPPFQGLNRRLLIRWCESRSIEGTKFNSYHSYLQLALQCHIPEAFPRLLEVAKSQKITAYARGTATLYAIALVSEKDLRALEGLVNDSTVIANPRYGDSSQQLECRISDYALLGLAMKSGLAAGELGFGIRNVTNALTVDRNQIGFQNQQDREKAIRKWLEYRRRRYPDWPETVIRAP